MPMPVDDRERLVGLVWDQPNEELRLSIELALIRQALKSNLVKSLIIFTIKLFNVMIYIQP